MCFGSSAPAAGAKEAVKEALTLRRLLVEGEQQVPGKIEKKEKKKEKKEERNNSIHKFLMAVLCVQQLMQKVLPSWHGQEEIHK